MSVIEQISKYNSSYFKIKENFIEKNSIYDYQNFIEAAPYP